jgi:thiosulfate/3-mercaptopyruvate sulfurtransferase
VERTKDEEIKGLNSPQRRSRWVPDIRAGLILREEDLMLGRTVFALVLLFSMCWLPSRSGLLVADAMGQQATSIPSASLMNPEDLAKLLQGNHGEKPVILQVGSHVLFAQAHIAGSSYAGPAGQEAGIAKLREQVKPLAHDRLIIIYCGCCPWTKCPNIEPAYRELVAMGFTQVRALYIKDNFGADWVSHGYPTAKGE